MAAQIDYLRDRDGVFQYERRVPLPVQRNMHYYAALFGSRPLFRKSLRTKNAAEATKAYTKAHEQFEALVAQALNRPASVVSSGAKTGRVLTQDEVDAIIDRYAKLHAAPFERLHLLADSNPGAAAALAHMQSELELNAEEIQAVIHSRSPPTDSSLITPIEEARFIITDRNLAVEEGSPEFGAVVGAVRAGMVQGYKRISALGAGDVALSLPSRTAKASLAKSLSIRQAVESYIGHREMPIKTKQETMLALKQFEEVVGDKLLTTLTKDDFITFVEHLSSQKVGNKARGSIERPLGKNTVLKRLRCIKSAITNAQDRNLFSGPNPAEGIKVASFVRPRDKSIMPDKRRLTIAEMNSVLQHPWFTGCHSVTNTHEPGRHRLTGCHYWVPILALYTGCRAAELGGLKLSEVRIDAAMPHFLIRANEHRRTKGGYDRAVPILDALLDLGFADYVGRIANSGADRLFPDWDAPYRLGSGEADYPAWSNSDLIRSFNRTVIPTRLVDVVQNGVRQPVTFHSFRGAFKAMLILNGIQPVIVHEIIAHSKSELDQRYIGQLTIEETYPHVKGCNYNGLMIPPAF